MTSNKSPAIFEDIPANWELTTLGDVCKRGGGYVQTGPFGSQLHASDYVQEGIPTIMPVNIGNNQILTEGIARISEKDAKRLSRHRLEPGDIVFSRRGDVTRRALIREEQKGWLCGTGSLKIHFGQGVVDPLFASLYFGHPDVKDWIIRHAVGSTMPNLNGKIMEAIPFLLPPKKEQEKIARILGALDDKVELNRRMGHTLEVMAQSLFQDWFVNNREIEKWDVVPLPEIIEVNPYRSLKKADIAPYLDMANMPTHGHRGIEWVDRPFGSGTKFINGDTLLARITPCLENGKTAFVDFLEDGQVGWGSTEYIVLRPKPPLPPEYGYYLARSDDLRNHAIQNMMGTSGRQRTPASCFNTYEIVKPPLELAQKFGGFAKSVITKVRANDQESRALVSIRDTLLSKLISGELRLKQAEKVIENM
jgi:type I restriction enzyme S subunit